MAKIAPNFREINTYSDTKNLENNKQTMIVMEEMTNWRCTGKVEHVIDRRRVAEEPACFDAGT